jgi:hypothetical protein
MGVEEKPLLSLTIAALAAGTTDQLRPRERYHIESRGTSASQLRLSAHQKLGGVTVLIDSGDVIASLHRRAYFLRAGRR